MNARFFLKRAICVFALAFCVNFLTLSLWSEKVFALDPHKAVTQSNRDVGQTKEMDLVLRIQQLFLEEGTL